MESNVVITPGDAISKIILVKNYSLSLRSDANRTVVNNRLKELNLEGGVHARVIVDKFDKLAVLISSHNYALEACVTILEGINVEKEKTEGKLSKKDVLCDCINQTIININKSIMNKEAKKAAKAVADERENNAQKLMKIIMLCGNDDLPLAVEYGGFNPSEACRKLTGGVIDSVLVQDGNYILTSKSGINLTLVSGSHSEKFIKFAISSYIQFMMKFNDDAKPFREDATTLELLESLSIQAVDSTDTKDVDCLSGQAVDSNTEIKEQFNKFFIKRIEPLQKVPDVKSRSRFSMLLRSAGIDSSEQAGLKISGPKSLKAIGEYWNEDSKNEVRNLHRMYNYDIPKWLKITNDNTLKKLKAS